MISFRHVAAAAAITIAVAASSCSTPPTQTETSPQPPAASERAQAELLAEVLHHAGLIVDPTEPEVIDRVLETRMWNQCDDPALRAVAFAATIEATINDLSDDAADIGAFIAAATIYFDCGELFAGEVLELAAPATNRELLFDSLRRYVP